MQILCRYFSIIIEEAGFNRTEKKINKWFQSLFLEKLVSFVSLGDFIFSSFRGVPGGKQRHPVDTDGIAPWAASRCCSDSGSLFTSYVCAERPYVRVCMLAPWRN